MVTRMTEKVFAAAFEAADAPALRRAAEVRSKARELVELLARRAALELAQFRGARLSQVREAWDRCGFFVFREPLGNAWMGVDLSPDHPLSLRFSAPAAVLKPQWEQLKAEGLTEEGDEYCFRYPLPIATPLPEVAEQCFSPLWRLWSLCHAAAEDQP